MPPRTTELTRSASWRALASSSLCTLPKLLGRLLCANLGDGSTRKGFKNKQHSLLLFLQKTKLQKRLDEQSVDVQITRSEAFIPGVCCPGFVVFGTWEGSLGGALDPVVNLQRRIYTCREMGPKQGRLTVAQLHSVTRKHVHFCLSFSFFFLQSRWFMYEGR